MDVKNTISVTQLPKRDAFKPPNLTRPPKKTATVSAAAIFKKQKYDTPQACPSSRSPPKSTVKRSGRRRQDKEVHPLALAFKETSEEYRRHLFSNAVAKINKILDALPKKLYESHVQIASSNPAHNGSQALPLKLTVHAAYQRSVQKLCNPLSDYRDGMQHTKTTGETERVQTTLYDRFQCFEQHTQSEMRQIEELQRQWEGVVAEIFQLGVACLGEQNIAALLSTAETDAGASSPAAPAESTLFVPEHGSPAKKEKGKRKRVSFASPDLMTLFPEFLFDAAGLQKKSVPAALDMPQEAIHQLEGELAGLGKQHVADLQRLEKEDQQWWKRKQTQLAHSFMQD